MSCLSLEAQRVLWHLLDADGDTETREAVTADSSVWVELRAAFPAPAPDGAMDGQPHAERMTDKYVAEFQTRATQINRLEAQGDQRAVDELHADLMEDCVAAVANGGIAHPTAVCAAAMGWMGDRG